jgi:hypothetical protein
LEEKTKHKKKKRKSRVETTETSLEEFTTASTSKAHGVPLHKYNFALTSWSSANFEALPIFVPPFSDPANTTNSPRHPE